MSHSSAIDLLSFSEPSPISSRQFLTQAYQQPTRDGIDYFYTPNSTAVIEISGQSMNQFIIPNTLRLCYQAIHNTTFSDTGATPVAAANCPVLPSTPSLQNCPGVPYYGAPHLGSVVCEVPGLSSDGFSYLTADGQSQPFYISRLLCSGNDGYQVKPGSNATFGQVGRAKLAGGRDVVERAASVAGGLTVYTTAPLTGVASSSKLPVHGSFLNYSVPASGFFALANGSTNCLPLSYLTGSSTNLSLRINWAAISNTMNVASYPLSF